MATSNKVENMEETGKKEKIWKKLLLFFADVIL